MKSTTWNDNKAERKTFLQCQDRISCQGDTKKSCIDGCLADNRGKQFCKKRCNNEPSKFDNCYEQCAYEDKKGFVACQSDCAGTSRGCTWACVREGKTFEQCRQIEACKSDHIDSCMNVCLSLGKKKNYCKRECR